MKLLHMRRNFKFLQNMDEEKSEILHICQVEKFLHMTDMEKSEISPHLHIMCLMFTFVLRFTLFCREIYFVAIYALLCGKKLNQKLHMWRKNDRYAGTQ